MEVNVHSLTKRHRHFAKFLVVGGTNTGVDFVLYFLFANILSIYPVTANIFSTGLTMCLSFYLNHRFVFESGKKKRHTVLQFFSATAFNVWIVQSAVIAVIVHSFQNSIYFIGHVWTLNLLAKFGGVCISLALNFFMYRYIFHQPTQEEVIV